MIEIIATRPHKPVTCENDSIVTFFFPIHVNTISFETSRLQFRRPTPVTKRKKSVLGLGIKDHDKNHTMDVRPWV